MNVTTAIILASGFGSRSLPVTAGVQKEMLPILNRPVVDYVVEDCLKAGITRIIFVVRPGSRQLQDLYLGTPTLDTYLQRYGKQQSLESLQALRQRAQFEFIDQPADAGYGNGVPVRIARSLLAADEAAVICDGDAFVYRADGKSEIAGLIETFRTAGGAVTGLPFASDQLHKYGVMVTRTQNGQDYLGGFVEKPAPGMAPSDLVNMSKHVMTSVMFDYVDRLEINPSSGEFFITDAILACALEYPVAVHHAQGKFLDAGNTAGWLEANLVMAQADPALAAVVEATTRQLASVN